MQVVLRQTFPLGRFHATPWRANVFDDHYGKWPPSPWRLIRAIAARWHQWRRELGDPADDDSLDRLVRALSTSRVSFHLPPSARRGPGLRQYQPVEFGWQPPSKTKKVKGKTVQVPGMKAYGTTLVQDNFWAVPPDSAVWWFLEGDTWDNSLLEVLDRCIERLLYFGRAETLTEFRRWTWDLPVGCDTNCLLEDELSSTERVPVLSARTDAKREDVERVTDHKELRHSTVPAGARWTYARLPGSSRVRRRPATRARAAPPVHLIQFAIATAVAPEPRVTCRLTSRFRERVLNALARRLSGDPALRWRRAREDVLLRLAGISGLGPGRIPIRGHEHARFLVWFQDGMPERLLVWRGGSPFDDDEESAILKAARTDLSWSAVPRDESWSVRLLPLDHSAPAPLGFEGSMATTWETVTPYVPSRHRFRRGGRERVRENIDSQIRRGLRTGGWPSAAHQVEIEIVGPPIWTSVRLPPSKGSERPFLGDRPGFMARLSFIEAVPGPIVLGHSSHFGLGVFAPRLSE